jgi:hypothetical protein
MSTSGQRPSKADVGGQRVSKPPKQKPAAKPNEAGGKKPSPAKKA